MKTSRFYSRLANCLVLAAGMCGAAASAAPVHFSLTFGDRNGPNSGTLGSTSLAQILTGNAEGLFAPGNLQYAAFSGIGVLGFGNVTGVSAITHDSTDANCVDKCRTISGNLFQGGNRSGSYSINWYFNDVLSDTTEFPPNSGLQGLKNVRPHPVFPGSIDYPGSLVGYTPYTEYANLYNAELTISNLMGDQVFNALFRSNDCTELGFACSAFEVTNNYEKRFGVPVDGLFMHFEGPVGSVPEPGSLALVGLSLFGLTQFRRRTPRA